MYKFYKKYSKTKVIGLALIFNVIWLTTMYGLLEIWLIFKFDF